MRSLRLAAAGLALLASTAFASPTAPRDGVEYTTLATPQPVHADGKKVEVIEFFMYHCPFCNALEPELEKWVRKQGDRIAFRRIHMPYTGANDPEAHLHLTLEAMGLAEAMQPKVFKAVHVDRIRLHEDAAIIDWVAHNGIDRDKFLGVWNSFGVMSMLHRAPRVIDSYGMRFVPALVIDGKYQTAPSTLESAMPGSSPAQVFEATFQVADALVAKAAKTK
jgi:thiol:disulfide interchange protein DsbA